MARPITWKTINAPQSNPASALSVASGAFEGAGRGFKTFSDQMLAGVERQNEERTNAHIRAALEGNPLPADSRVDPTAVQDAVQKQDKFKSDELTAIMTRTGQGLTQAKQGKELSVFDENQQAELEGLRAGTASERQDIALSKAQLGAVQGQERDRKENKAKREEIDRGWYSILDESVKRQEGQVETILGQIREQNPTITDAEIETIRRDDVMPMIQAKAAEEQGAQALTYEAEVRSRLSPDAATFNASSFGDTLTQQRQASQKDASEGKFAAKKQATKERGWAQDAADGDLTKMIPTSTGFRAITSAGEGERNAIPVKNAKGVAAYMKSQHRVELDDDELQLAHQALQSLGGNKRAFEELISGEVITKDNWFWFTGDHETVENWKAIRKAAGTAGRAMRAEATRLAKEAKRTAPGALSAEDMGKRLASDIANSRFVKDQQSEDPDKIFQNIGQTVTGTISR
jgi:hypothetical protein